MTIQVGLELNGGRIELRVSEHLRVVLAGVMDPAAGHGGGGGCRADAVATGCRARLSGARGRVGGVHRGPQRPGGRDAQTDFGCLHTRPMCAMPQEQFSLTVLVVPPTGQGANPLPVPPVS